MNVKDLFLKRKTLLKNITTKFYQREKLNIEIRDIKKELDALDRMVLYGEVKKNKIVINKK